MGPLTIFWSPLRKSAPITLPAAKWLSTTLLNLLGLDIILSRTPGGRERKAVLVGAKTVCGPAATSANDKTTLWQFCAALTGFQCGHESGCCCCPHEDGESAVFRQQPAKSRRRFVFNDTVNGVNDSIERRQIRLKDQSSANGYSTCE